MSSVTACVTTQGPSQPATTIQITEPASDAAPAAAGGYHCDGKPFRIGGRDHCAYTTPLTWAEARKACESTGARLASFASSRKAEALLKVLGPSIGAAEGLWLGLHEKSEGSWEWSGGAALSYAHWNGGEPNDDGGNEDCAEWRLGSGTWNDAPCDDYRPYVCERQGPKPMECTGKWVRAGGSEYCFVLNAPRSWSEAEAECTQRGGALAVLSTQEEDVALYAAVGPRLGLLSVWVGFNDIAREGMWRWVSGERTEVYEAEWKYGEPNDFHQGEDCAEWFSEDGKMNDLACSAKRPYLCEAPSP